MLFFKRAVDKSRSDALRGPFAKFAARASKGHASTEIALSDTMQFVDTLAAALAQRYPDLDRAEANDFAVAGLQLRCPRCGPMGGQAVSALYLAGSGVLDGGLATGPNAASAARCRCPGCGSTTAVAEFSAHRVKDRAKELKRAKKSSALAAKEKGKLIAACPAIPYLSIYPYNHDFEVSPDGSMVCCLTIGGSLGAYESGTDRLVWTVPVPATDGCLFRFVGSNRLLVLSGKRNEPGQVLLVKTSDGSILDSTNPIKMDYNVGDSDYRRGLFVGQAAYDSLLVVRVAGDRIEVSTHPVGNQIHDLGPKLGPDGNIYFGEDTWGNWHCLENGIDRTFIRIAHPHKCACIAFESPTTVYFGSGYADRSGPSALFIADPTNATREVIGWDKEPIDEIACFGSGLLLLANTTSKANPAVFPNAVITCFSAQNKQKVWTQSFVPRKPLRRVILATAPEQGWALVQTGTMFKVIDVADGRVIRVLNRPSEEYVKASWVASRSLVYISGTPGDRKPGLLECYRF